MFIKLLFILKTSKFQTVKCVSLVTLPKSLVGFLFLKFSFLGLRKYILKFRGLIMIFWISFL